MCTDHGTANVSMAMWKYVKQAKAVQNSISKALAKCGCIRVTEARAQMNSRPPFHKLEPPL